MTSPLIQIIVPAYGESPYLHETLNSICDNSPSNVAVLVIDDCSPTDTIKKIVERFKSRVNYVRNVQRLGIADNFNNAVNLSSGKYTLILGSDDLLGTKFSEVYYQLSMHESKIGETAGIIFDASVINSDTGIHLKIIDFTKKIFRPKFYRNLKILSPIKFLLSIVKGDWVYFPAILWNTKVLSNYKFSNSFNSAMDLDIFIKISFDNIPFTISKSKLISYRRHNESASLKNFIDDRRFQEEIKCHKFVFEYAILKKKFYLALISIIAPSVRINAIFNLIKSRKFNIKNLLNLLLQF